MDKEQAFKLLDAFVEAAATSLILPATTKIRYVVLLLEARV
jgi:hypothetical protein